MVIIDVFEHFLAEQQATLAPKTYREYASVLDLFAHQLEGYGWNNIPQGTKAYEAAKKKGRRVFGLLCPTEGDGRQRVYSEDVSPRDTQITTVDAREEAGRAHE